MKYPRLLIINGEPFGTESGSGITLSALLAGWPRDRVASLFTSQPRRLLPHTPYCRIRLHGSRIYESHEMSEGGSSRGGNWLGSFIENVNGRFSNPHLGSARVFLRTIEDFIPYHISARIWKWIRDFNPDLVYSMLGNIQLVRLALRVGCELGIPVLPHFMDDWISTKYAKSGVLKLNRRTLLGKLSLLFEVCPFGLAISRGMASEYEALFGLPFWEFMNCVNTTIPLSKPTRAGVDGIVKCAYVGGLHLNRWCSLKDIGECVRELRGEGLNVEVTVYAPPNDIAEYGKFISMPSAMQIGGTIAPDDVSGILRESDILIHVESFEREVRRYTRLSLSTKIPQYMASGRAILAYGPGEIESVRYIQETGSGLAVGGKNREQLKASLRRLVLDKSLRIELGKRGREVASTHHEAEKQREEFRKRVVSAVAMHKAKPSTEG